MKKYFVSAALIALCIGAPPAMAQQFPQASVVSPYNLPPQQRELAKQPPKGFQAAQKKTVPKQNGQCPAGFKPRDGFTCIQN
ncbi:hypothetical protein [Bosea sp. R86505]|uniref:hypothetical protein n=1 Tax=Bosea sp. R86505 TaxID=3101710 RepID=UPI00366F1D62